eukprot:2286941-Amphidinium_carterae.1
MLRFKVRLLFAEVTGVEASSAVFAALFLETVKVVIVQAPLGFTYIGDGQCQSDDGWTAGRPLHHSCAE